MALTSRGRLVAGIGVTAFLSAFALGLQAAWIVACFCAALLLLAVVTVAGRRGAWTVHRALPHALVVGTDAEVTIELRPRNRRRTPRVDIVEHVDGRRVTHCIVDPMHAGDRTEFRWTIRPTRRGPTTVGPLLARVDGPLRLVRRTRVVAPGTTVLVLPATVRLERPPPRTGGRSRPVTRQGSVGELSATALREYVAGDDPRLVHWKASARRGTLVVRQRDGAANDEVSVLLDTRPEVHDAASFERAVSVVASIVLTSARFGLTTEVWTTDGTVILERSERAPDAALQRLAHLRPTAIGTASAAGAPSGLTSIVVTAVEPPAPGGALTVTCRVGHHPDASRDRTTIDAAGGLEAFAARWEAWHDA